jgi:uncharacterized membrane protein HdeD (DUF308 family)
MDKIEKEMRSIWYFIGWLFVVIGALILISGIYHLISPVEVKTVLYEIHPNIWWGGLILIVGIVFLITHRTKIVKKQSD